VCDETIVTYNPGVQDALEACRYVIDRVRVAAGPRWRQGRRIPPFACASLAEEARLVAERRLCGVSEPAARALSAWVRGERPAVRLHHAPSPREVLARMARAERPVSLLEDEGGLAFALHDLCHLEKFSDPAHHGGQVALFARIDRVIDGPGWSALEAGLDESWHTHRDHVLADMNGSAVFLYLVLRARLIDACARAGVASRVRELDVLLGTPPGANRDELARHFGD
jgi:hypothetical protein